MAKTPSRKKSSSAARPALTLAHQAAHESLLPLILSFPPVRTATSEAAPAQAIKTPAAPVAPAAPAATITPEERHQLIARHAFQRAQRRGLGSTDPFHDWLTAEREINALLTAGASSLSV